MDGRIRLVCLLFALMVQPVLLQAEVRVLTSTGMIADAVRNIGGDLVHVGSLMGAGIDPHVYKATHGDMKRLREAEVVFYNGLHLEGRMTEIFEQVGKRKPCVPIASRLPAARILHAEADEPIADPHIWFDIDLWVIALQEIRDVLSKFDPENAPAYAAGYARYSAQLHELHQWVASELQKIPPEQRVLLTAHDAFNYFGYAYDIEVRGLQGINTTSEFGLYDVKELVDMVLARQIKAVFVETSVSKKFITALQEGVRARGGAVAIGGELYSDAMGVEGTPEGTFVGMVRHNVQTIVNALQ